MLGLGRAKALVVDEPVLAWGAAAGVDERYAPLVERLSDAARKDPAAYRRRVLFAAALGYAAIGALVLGCAGIIVGLLYLMVEAGGINLLLAKALIVAALIAWAALRSLWVVAEPPEGRPIDRSEAPALFELVRRLRSRIGGPRIDQVLISREFNASIVQLPRLGFLGWYRNYLVLGLPLLRGMAEEEAAAVIAHELGHFAGEHGRLASAVYRVRMTWAQLSERLRQGHSANLLRRFFRWYGPWFSAYSFVLARSHEYEADRAAAAATSPATMAAALVRVAVQADRLESGWARWWDQAVRDAGARPRPFTDCANWLRDAGTKATDRSLRRALFATTGLDDTHPCLVDRLGALGADARVPALPQRSAADVLLGAAADRIAAEFDESWWRQVSGAVEEAREQRRREAEELRRLRELAAEAAPTREQRRREAELVASVEGEEASIPLYDALAEEDGEDVLSAWYAALYRLRSGDPAGAPMLESLGRRTPRFALASLEALLAHYEEQGDWDSADEARRRLAQVIAWQAAADAEFRTLRPEDPIEAPDLTPDERAGFRRSVDGIPGLVSVHVGWRRLAHGGGRQQVLLVKVRDPADPGDVLGSVGERLPAHGDYLGFTLASDTRWLHARLKALEGAQLYP
ncbi:MAG TPA: M48 family metallopeptidase [Allosphingosinicella sp.]|jgi:Zn-dependent protease with chaperone function